MRLTRLNERAALVFSSGGSPLKKYAAVSEDSVGTNKSKRWQWDEDGD